MPGKRTNHGEDHCERLVNWPCVNHCQCFLIVGCWLKHAITLFTIVILVITTTNITAITITTAITIDTIYSGDQRHHSDHHYHHPHQQQQMQASREQTTLRLYSKTSPQAVHLLEMHAGRRRPDLLSPAEQPRRPGMWTAPESSP